jgi:hypothetical protein
LERYVAKKKERERIALELEAACREDEAAPGVEVVPEPRKEMNGVDSNKDESTPEEDAKKFGLVTEADKEVDDQAIQKLNAMLAERYRGQSLCLFVYYYGILGYDSCCYVAGFPNLYVTLVLFPLMIVRRDLGSLLLSYLVLTAICSDDSLMLKGKIETSTTTATFACYF